MSYIAKVRVLVDVPVRRTPDLIDENAVGTAVHRGLNEARLDEALAAALERQGAVLTSLDVSVVWARYEPTPPMHLDEL